MKEQPVAVSKSGTSGAVPVGRIPVFAPAIGIDTVRHVTEALEAGWLGLGNLTREFEERVHDYLDLGQRRIVATNTGTAALHIALLAAGVGPGDEVITPSFNYVADHQAIAATGAKVVMVDIREEDLGIDCQKAEELLTDNTKAILPLHFAGIPCDLDGVYRLATKYGIRVIEDCCHAFGTEVRGRKLGSFGDMAAFSFDPVKIITSIDGGAVVVDTEAELEHLRHLRLLGVDKDTLLRYKNQRAWDYDVLGPGFRYHLNNIMASVGISQVKRANEFISSRRSVCQKYNEAFRGIDGLRLPPSDFEGVSPFIYSLRVLGGRRDAFIDHLRVSGVDAGVHFVPVHRHTHFRECRRGDMAVTDQIVRQAVTIPLHSNMRESDVKAVIDATTSFFE